MRRIFPKRLVSVVLYASIALAAYFLSVEVQSYWGRQAVERTGLVSVPLEQAFARAKTENKLVLVDVSAIWCSTCRKLDNAVFSDGGVKRFIGEHFIFTRLEYESEEGQQFLEEHEVSGFPNLWLLDGDEKVVKRLRVVFTPADFLSQLPE